MLGEGGGRFILVLKCLEQRLGVLFYDNFTNSERDTIAQAVGSLVIFVFGGGVWDVGL